MPKNGMSADMNQILQKKIDVKYHPSVNLYLTLPYLSYFKNVHIVYYYLYNQVFSPTDTQLDSLKNNCNFVLKLTLKSSYMFRCENTIIREHTV